LVARQSKLPSALEWEGVVVALKGDLKNENHLSEVLHGVEVLRPEIGGNSVRKPGDGKP